MNKLVNLIIVFFLSGFFGASIISGETLTIVTEDYPPYNYMENGRITGFSTEIVEAIVRKAGLQGIPKMYPWARAYMMVQNDKDVLIYTITRNQEREE